MVGAQGADGDEGAKADLDLVQGLHKQQALATEAARLKLEQEQQLQAHKLEQERQLQAHQSEQAQQLQVQKNMADDLKFKELDKQRDREEMRRQLEKQLEKQTKELEGQLNSSRKANAALKANLETYRVQQGQLQEALDKAKAGKRSREPCPAEDDDDALPPPPPPVRL